MSVLILALIDIMILAAWAPMAFVLRSTMKAFALAVGALAAVTFIAAFHKSLGQCGPVDGLGGIVVWGTLAALFVGPMALSAVIDHGHHVRAIVWAFSAMALTHLVFMDTIQPLNCVTLKADPPLWYLATCFVLNSLAATFLGPLTVLTENIKTRFQIIAGGLVLMLVSLEMARRIFVDNVVWAG